MKKYVSILLISIAFLLTSCGIFRKTERKNPENPFAKELLKTLPGTYYQGKALKVLGKMKFQDANNNLKTSFKMFWLPDSAYFFSLSMFGLEGAKMFVSKTRFKMLNRLQKKAYDFALPKLLEKYKLSLEFPQMEKILLGEFPVEWVKNANIKAKTAEGIYEITGNLLQGKAQFQATLSLKNYHLKNLNIEYDGYKTFVNYSEYLENGGHPFPASVSVKVSGKRDMELEIKNNKFVYLNNIPKLDFSIPKGYEIIKNP